MKELDKIFNPRSVAVIGATDRPQSVGLGLCKNLLQGKEKRDLYFVNPNRDQVLDYETFPKITSIEESVDLAVIAVPAQIVPQVVKECCQKKVGSVIIISAGFAETGKEGQELQDRILEMAKEAEIPLVGPNCLGIIRPSEKLNATFAPATPRAGKIGFISQSGALIDAVIDRSLIENYGFSSIISYGNEADLKLQDFLEWVNDDKETKVVALYLEAIKDGREFMDIAKKVLKKKPIVALKAGKTKAGKKAVSSHTAALAGSAKIYSGVFKQLGILEVQTLEGLFDVSKALAWQPRSENGIGVVTNGGGAGILAADFCQKLGIKLPDLSPKTLEKLEQSGKMNPAFSKRNPLDIVGDALAGGYRVAIEALLSQSNVRGLIVVQTPQVMTEVEKNAKVIIEAQNKFPEKPIICCFMGGKITKPGIDLLEKNKISNYPDPKRAAQAMEALIKNK